MFTPLYTSRFYKDLKRMQKTGRIMDNFKDVAAKLIGGVKLERRYKDHKLLGVYKNRRECHIEPDWLLIYKIEGKDIIFERMGSHSDLFR